MVTAMQPSLDGLKNAIKRVPEEKFQQNLGEVVAGHKGQTAASEFVHNALDFDTTEEPITEQIHWFLWMF